MHQVGSEIDEICLIYNYKSYKDKLLVTISFNKINIQMEVDTGAAYTVISE